MISVVTLNLLDDLLLWERRAPLVLEVLRTLQPHAVALQEVSLDPNTADWLAHRLPGYSAYVCPRTRAASSDSLAVLARSPILSHDVLHLGAQGRQAQRVRLSTEEGIWTLVNTHLLWNPFDDSVRRNQAARILEWVREDERVILCGDLNALPTASTLALLRGRLRSAHEAAHGQEPAFTYPTPLARGPGLRHWARHAVLRANGLLRRRRNVRFGGTVDYIMVDPSLRVLSCEVILNQPSPGDSRLYASDHFGLAAVLEAGGPA